MCVCISHREQCLRLHERAQRTGSLLFLPIPLKGIKGAAKTTLTPPPTARERVLPFRPAQKSALSFGEVNALAQSADRHVRYGGATRVSLADCVYLALHRLCAPLGPTVPIRTVSGTLPRQHGLSSQLSSFAAGTLLLESEIALWLSSYLVFLGDGGGGGGGVGVWVRGQRRYRCQSSTDLFS